ncbi:MAG: glycosyltransferase family 2 protein [Deltaproteobacteria bacterium]|nr:glycosyltransferase family 2 protein [Deltaproteobacteria bacterium]MBW2024933.1 glycosyltransferase family 2 protein [Deltaproteobacteria bacterium]MBW2124962.1 glycosyltransferase family 2 protein [Deltaproteobacteria bacterium]
MINKSKYIVITPVRDEGSHIARTIESMILQTLRPLAWAIVNDGSTDNTGDVIERYSKKYSWIKALHRKNRGYRHPGTGVIEAFYEGYNAIKLEAWKFLVKLDGDLTFDPDYFENCLKHFKLDPTLGIGGGTVCLIKDGKVVADSPSDPPFHVRGATKIYRRECWEQIAPLIKAPGWDTVDEVKANMYGWTTRTFQDLKVIQLKATGGADGIWRNWYKNGLANYVAGYHPAFMLAKCLKRALRRPVFVASMALWLGFCSGYIKKIPRTQGLEAIRYLRNQQVRRLLMQRSIYG